MELYEEIFKPKDKNLRELIDKNAINIEDSIEYVIESKKFKHIIFFVSNLEGINLHKL